MQILRLFFNRSYEGNIPKFFAAHALYNFMLFLPIWVIFLQEKHGLSLTQVTFVDFAFWITMVLTEVPTGAVADTIGRKASQLIGIALSALSLLFFAFAPTYPLLLVANSLWAVAMTFISGADMAFFYDSLRVLGRQNEYARLRGMLSALALVATGVASGLGGLFAAWNITSPFWITAAVLLLALIIASSYLEPDPEPDPDTGKRISFAKTIKLTSTAIRKVPSLPYVLLYSNVLPLPAAAILTTFIQPHAIAIGIPLASIGFLIFGLTIFRILGATSADRLVMRLGEWRLLTLAPVLTVVGIIGLGAFNSILGIALLALAVFASAVSRPLIESIILHSIPGSVRATILSVDNLIFRLLLAFSEPLAGIAGDAWGLSVSFILMGVGVATSLSLLLPLWRRVWTDEKSTAS
jgi:MFS family permease